MKQRSQSDPKGLIYEAYRKDGISDGECRTIFLDWALSLPDGIEQRQAMEEMVARYQTEQPDHPMTELMAQGLTGIATPRRRGGWRGRTRN